MADRKIVQVYWDTSDPGNEGWAYRCDHPAASGPLGSDLDSDEGADLLELARAAWSGIYDEPEIRVYSPATEQVALVYRGEDDWRRQ